MAQKSLEPRASALVESIRDIGYSLATAVADVIDNSITAAATRIELLADTHTDVPVIGILDDGVGMAEEKLLEALRLGSMSPLEERPEHDLGRFGLGLKTASFSQCRRLTVISRKGGCTTRACWDLDLVASTNKWVVEVNGVGPEERWIEKLGETGTLVIWEKLDRLVDQGNPSDRDALVRQLSETSTHLELVFHRYLTGEPGLRKISMSLNGTPLVPFDPFHSGHRATVLAPVEVFQLGDKQIRIQGYTLPHHKKVTAEDWRRYGGVEGYTRNQGFYLYREKRLIVHGTWFGLARQTELTKLSRVQIDVPNGMDAAWKVDVKKASAQPPAPVRRRLQRIIEAIGAGSKKAFTARGKRLTEDNRVPVWSRAQDKNQISYFVDSEHPLINKFSASLNPGQRAEFDRVMKLIAASVPLDTLFSDISSSPERVVPMALEDEDLRDAVVTTLHTLRGQDKDIETVLLMMKAAEPFRSSWERVLKIVEEQDAGGVDEAGT